MRYYIVDDGTSEPWIYDDGESFRNGLENGKVKMMILTMMDKSE